jgi:hypothetical protein
MLPDDALAALRRYPLLDALRERRSRRFGLGMAMPEGPLAYRSRHPGLRLTEGWRTVCSRSISLRPFQ